MCPFMRAFGLGVARPSFVPVDCVTYWYGGAGRRGIGSFCLGIVDAAQFFPALLSAARSVARSGARSEYLYQVHTTGDVFADYP